MNHFFSVSLTVSIWILLCNLSLAESESVILQDFLDYKTSIQEDFSAYQKISQEETQSFKAKIRQKWDVAELSNKTLWVEYCDNFNQKNKVDFDKGTISITRIQGGKKSKKSLASILSSFIHKNKIQAYEDDLLSRAIEKRSLAVINNLQTAPLKPEAILLPLITGKNNVSKDESTSIVESMLDQKRLYASYDSRGKELITLEVPLYINQKNSKNSKNSESRNESPVKHKRSSHHISYLFSPDIRLEPENTQQAGSASSLSPAIPAKAQGIKKFVEIHSKKHQIAPEIILAIVEAESSFNPMARSGIPAYGLMQIVPVSAGQDATKKLFGRAKILAPSYLYDSENNIEIGAAYLNILYFRYLKAIENPLSRLYCTIAAYNTGAGNVAKAFTGLKRIGPAANKINSMSPEEVYQHLLINLPYQETQVYLKKVNRLASKYRV